MVDSHGYVGAVSVPPAQPYGADCEGDQGGNSLYKRSAYCLGSVIATTWRGRGLAMP